MMEATPDPSSEGTTRTINSKDPRVAGCEIGEY